MVDRDASREPNQELGTPARQRPQQQHQKRHEPSGEGAANLANKTPKGGTAQDGFAQSGTQGTPNQTEHNARPSEAT